MNDYVLVEHLIVMRVRHSSLVEAEKCSLVGYDIAARVIHYILLIGQRFLRYVLRWRACYLSLHTPTAPEPATSTARL